MPIYLIRSIYWMYSSQTFTFAVPIGIVSFCAAAAIATEEEAWRKRKR